MLFATHGARRLHGQMTRTYFSLRLGLGVIALMLPWALWLGAWLRDGEPLRCSISAYYYSSMRDVLVGALVAIGTFLFLYRGFNPKEDRALKAGGVFAIGIAMVPTGNHCGGVATPISAGAISAHGVLAVLFFACIAYVCVFRAPDTLVLVRDKAVARRFWVVYRAFGGALVVAPLAAALLAQARRRAGGGDGHVVFFIEASAVLVFALFWLTKSRELELTDSVLLAGELTLHGGTRRRAPLGPGDESRVERRTSV